MTQINNVSKNSIKIALSEGFITTKEADEMSKVYLAKQTPPLNIRTKVKAELYVPLHINLDT